MDNGSTGNGCSVPGQIEYNTSQNRLEFCNGSFWHSMMADTTGTGCSDAGRFYYDSGTNNYLVCNGSGLVKTEPTPDDCTASPSIGDTCTGGAIYAGVFDGAKYMVIPGDCNDSTTPTCDGTEDNLKISWKGTGGSTAAIAGVESIGSATQFSSPNYRGDGNMAAAIASGNIGTGGSINFCNDLDYGGFTDWYLPSKSEMAYLACKSAGSLIGVGYPDEAPDCTQYGGKQDAISGMASGRYATSTENTINGYSVWSVNLGGSGALLDITKTQTRYLRCVRRYGEGSVDITPDSINWADFSTNSSTETLSGFDGPLFLEISVADNSGSPTVEYNLNSYSWTTAPSGSSTLIAVRPADDLEFRISGTSGNSATITIKNATDTASTPTLDTAVASVP